MPWNYASDSSGEECAALDRRGFEFFKTVRGQLFNKKRVMLWRHIGFPKQMGVPIFISQVQIQIQTL